MGDKEYLKPLGLEENLMGRLASNWTVTVDRNGNDVPILLENLTVSELQDWWNIGISENEQDEQAAKLCALVYALDKLKAHMQFLTTEGYIQV